MDILPGFEKRSRQFMEHCQAVSEKMMRCFAGGLGFEEDFFIKAHDIKRDNIQSVLRLLHYFPVPKAEEAQTDVSGKAKWNRAGAHTDWDFLTLLFQLPNQGRLEICPGREAHTSFALGNTWTRVSTPQVQEEDQIIVCNIGVMLMSWSEDRFKSTFHRVATPEGTGAPGEFFGERYSMAFFNQPCTVTVIQGPLKKYDAMTAKEFTDLAMSRNFARLKATQEAMEKANASNEDPGVSCKSGSRRSSIDVVQQPARNRL
jgi:isopenicillin N synthase-like dioxygenase